MHTHEKKMFIIWTFMCPVIFFEILEEKRIEKVINTKSIQSTITQEIVILLYSSVTLQTEGKVKILTILSVLLSDLETFFFCKFTTF